jgi:hypothetical protein
MVMVEMFCYLVRAGKGRKEQEVFGEREEVGHAFAEAVVVFVYQ